MENVLDTEYFINIMIICFSLHVSYPHSVEDVIEMNKH